MDHKENYKSISSVLSKIATKGNDTLAMADCLRFLGQCIRKCEEEEKLEGDENVQS